MMKNKIIERLKEKKFFVKEDGKPKTYILRHVNLSFHALKEPKTTGKFPDNSYNADVFVLKDEFEEKCGALIKDLDAMAKEITGDKKATYTDITQAIADLDDSIVEGDKYAKYKEGRYRIRAKSKKYKPDLRNVDKTEMNETEQAQFSLGDVVNICVNIYPYAVQEVQVVNGKKTKVEAVKVSLGLLAVQKIRASESSGVSNAGEVFEDESAITDDDFKADATGTDDEF